MCQLKSAEFVIFIGKAFQFDKTDVLQVVTTLDHICSSSVRCCHGLVQIDMFMSAKPDIHSVHLACKFLRTQCVGQPDDNITSEIFLQMSCAFFRICDLICKGKTFYIGWSRRSVKLRIYGTKNPILYAWSIR